MMRLAIEWAPGPLLLLAAIATLAHGDAATALTIGTCAGFVLGIRFAVLGRGRQDAP